MADKRTRRRFTSEFKAQAVKRVLDGRSLSYDSRESLTLFRPPDPAIHLALPTTGIVIVFREAYQRWPPSWA
jgi:hypothetical protein